MNKAEYEKKMAELKKTEYKADKECGRADKVWYKACKAICDLEASWAKEREKIWTK